MGYTRRDVIDAAMADIGYANYAFDIQAEQLEAVKRRYDAMIAQWNAMGLRLGAPIPSSPENSTLNAESELPDSAWEAAITSLAVRIAPGLGKSVSPDTKRTAKLALNTLLGRATRPGQMQYPGTLPLGGGNKGWRDYQTFFAEPQEGVIVGPDGNLEL